MTSLTRAAANLLPPVARTEPLPLEIHLPGATPGESAGKQDAVIDSAGLPDAAPVAAGTPSLTVKAPVNLFPLSSPDGPTPVNELAFAARLTERLTVPEAVAAAAPAAENAAAAEATAPAVTELGPIGLQKPSSFSAVPQTAVSPKPALDAKSAPAANAAPVTDAVPERAAAAPTTTHETSDKKQENADSGHDQAAGGKDNPERIPHGETAATPLPAGPRYAEGAITVPAPSAREFAPSHSTKPVTQGTAVEPMQPEPAAERVSGQARDISVRLSNDNRPSVDLRVVERNGELHVAVRAADAGMTNALRNNLSELNGRLDHSGFQTEMWTPASAESSLADPKSKHGADGKDHPQGRGSGGNAGDGREQKHRDQQQPRWVEELENSFGNRRKP